MDEGFAEMRAEFRAVRERDPGRTAERRRTEIKCRSIACVLRRSSPGCSVTMILGFAAILLQHHL